MSRIKSQREYEQWEKEAMADILEALQASLVRKKAELQKVLNQLMPLENKRAILQTAIEAYERVIQSERPEPVSYRERETLILHGMSPHDGYKHIANAYLAEKPFKEREIRMIANNAGLIARNKAISASYSRVLLLNLVKEGFLEKVERGLYKVAETQGGGGSLESEAAQI